MQSDVSEFSLMGLQQEPSFYATLAVAHQSKLEQKDVSQLSYNTYKSKVQKALVWQARY